MNRLTTATLIALMALCCAGTPSMANGFDDDDDGPGGSPHSTEVSNDSFSESSSEATAVGVGVGIAGGGDASTHVGIDAGVDLSGAFNNEEAASSAATLILGTCQTGFSAQTHMGGGSVASPDTVCLLFTAAQLADSFGDVELRDFLLNRAVTILKARTNPVVRGIEATPLFRKIF